MNEFFEIFKPCIVNPSVSDAASGSGDAAGSGAGAGTGSGSDCCVSLPRSWSPAT